MRIIRILKKISRGSFGGIKVSGTFFSLVITTKYSKINALENKKVSGTFCWVYLPFVGNSRGTAIRRNGLSHPFPPVSVPTEGRCPADYNYDAREIIRMRITPFSRYASCGTAGIQPSPRCNSAVSSASRRTRTPKRQNRSPSA